MGNLYFENCSLFCEHIYLSIALLLFLTTIFTIIVHILYGTKWPLSNHSFIRRTLHSVHLIRIIASLLYHRYTLLHVYFIAVGCEGSTP